ncbi:MULTISPECIES: type II toxin-antitoxin system VapC family toxin [unclassified Providencia]|uniref:type II toxin-antitoxin system VapC family toxin n=1 Tax=unclassified Providencia TaxID=2633465 RepID=UPI00234AFC6A|nr:MULTISPECIES: PIN domain-containing protein [unclassified Providencia]
MKKIIVDTNILISLMKKSSNNANKLGADGFSSVDDLELRSKALLDHIERSGGTIVIPTPVLAEYLLGIDGEANKHAHVNLISSMNCFEILPFEELASVECSMLPSKQEFKQFIKQINSNETANKVRFDRQIIAIAKANGITEIWSSDGEVIKKGREVGIDVKSISDIQPIPLSDQFKLNLLDEIEAPTDKNQLN